MIDELKEQLKEKLKNIWDSKDYILGICSHLKTEEEVKRVLKYIDNKKWKYDWEITQYALFIAEVREGVVGEEILKQLEEGE